MFQAIFGPAIAIMSRLRFALKIGLVGALFLALIAGLGISINGKLSAEIQTAETERLGAPLVSPALRLALAVQTHRGRSALAASGDRAAKEKLPELASGVDEKLNGLSLANKQYGAPIGLSDALEPLMKQWLEIQSNNAQYTADESFKKHTMLVKAILDYMTLAADKSGLTLDPEMDTFYLMDFGDLPYSRRDREYGAAQGRRLRYSQAAGRHDRGENRLGRFPKVLRKGFRGAAGKFRQSFGRKQHVDGRIRRKEQRGS